MKTKLFSLFVALIATTALWASNTITYTATSKLPEVRGALKQDGLHVLSFWGMIGDVYFQLSISSHTFSNGQGTITFNGDVTNIREYAFYGCSGLTSVTIPNSVTTIGDYAFSNCTSLTSITIPNSVTKFGYSAFSNCTSLTSATIFSTTINSYAFQYCEGLTSVTIGNSVTTIGEKAFYECINLEEVKGCQNVAKMGSDVFGNTLWYLDQPDGLLYVGKVAYKYKGDMPRDTHITIKDGTLGIAPKAFYGCSGLTSVTIPNSVTTIGAYAFHRCSSLASVTIPNSVTTIGDYAFQYCEGLTSVTIPNSVTSIGGRAFESCSRLRKTNYTGTIADWCKIKFGYLANPTCYSHNLFINDVEIKGNLVIPEGIDTIGDYAFYNCISLDSVTIPQSVTFIGESAFEKCGLSVTINSNAICSKNYTEDSNIGNLFGDVYSYVIGNSVTSIGDYAFKGGWALSSITIPSSVTAIGSNAFNKCTYLEKIVCEIEKPLAITDDVFSTYNATLYVPAKGVNRYKLADVWKNFKTILPIQAKEVIVTETQVNPSANIVSIAWRAVENAYNYIIVIKQSEDTICKMTFNAEGQLVTSQYYAPQARALALTTDAEQTATGWRYVIRDLEPGTEYTYSIVAYDETDKAIDSQSGTFRTLLPSGLEDLTIDKKVGNKFIYGNQLYLRRGDKIYNAVGGAVR